MVRHAEQQEKRLIAAAWPQRHRSELWEPKMLAVFDRMVLDDEACHGLCMCKHLE